MKISGILPLKMTGRHYADNVARCDILFSSLRAFTTPDVFDRILIIVPGNEVQEATRYARAWSDFPVEVVDESKHFGAFKEFSALHQIRPWHRQQIIKLHASELIDTEYFMVFDPDVFATRPFTLDTLVRDGRALTHLQPRAREARYWLSSGEVLHLEPNLDRDGIWWTPAILSSTICRALHARLRAVHGIDWMRVLLQRYAMDWTEYTLYWLTAEQEGLIGTFHVGPMPGGADLHTDESVWFAGRGGKNLDAWEAERYFRGDATGLFAVVQSNTGLPIDNIVRKLNPYFPITIQPYDRHWSFRQKTGEWYSAGTRALMKAARRLR